jgi:hypothetical protein
MYSALDLQRLAVRIETLQQTQTHGWHPADEMEFRNKLPGKRHPVALPNPRSLRERARKQPNDFTEREAQTVFRVLRDMEDLIRRNDPRNPRRIMRDMARGRHPFQR